MRRLVGIGMGPGNPEMVTLGAMRELENASHIFAPTIIRTQAGRAEQVVRELLPNREIERIVFEMDPGLSGVRLREDAASIAAKLIVARAGIDESVAFVTLGDPSLYSTFYPLSVAVKRLEPDVRVTMVPGIPAFTYLAAKYTMDLLDNSERLFVIPVVRDQDLDRLKALLLDYEATIVIYKCAGRFPLVREALISTNRIESAFVGTDLGTATEVIGPAMDFGASALGYFATVIAPALRGRDAI